MPDHQKSSKFTELNDLLDQALELDGDDRLAFLSQLQEDQRNAVLKLLELAEAMTLGGVASQASATLEALTTDSEDGAGTDAGRWRLQREIGSGGMGQVFYATREEPSSEGQSGYVQQAAVKVLWSLRLDTELRARFFRERRILAALDHPGLARFLDGGILADGRPWFAMEYVDGIDVIEYSLQRPVKERLDLFIDICAAVSYAHEKLIVHRDIKPQNVLVDANGRPRLLDFGVASIIDDIDDGVVTRTSGSPLTLQYASPEQVSGKLVSVASDIYQLGLLLYQMLTGQHAYDLKDKSLTEALKLIDRHIPEAPSTLGPDIAPDLDAIVLTALNKAPNERYRSATAFAEDVQRYMSGHPVRAMPHSNWYVARRFIRRNFVLVSVVSVSVIALTVATFISLNLATEAREQARRSLASQQILSDVFEKADPFGEGGANITLADALLRARPAIDEQLAGDPVLTWEVNQNLAGIYESLGLAEQEAEAYEKLIDVAETLDDDQQFPRIVGVAGYGGTLARTNPAEAVAWFESNLKPVPEFDAEVVPWISAQYSHIGALTRLRSFEQADALALQMNEVVQRFSVSNPRTLGRLSQMLAGVARRAGDTGEEDKHWQNAVAHMRESGNRSALAVTLSNRAIFLGRNGRYKESDVAFKEAIAQFEDADHQDPSLAGILRSYAGLQFRMGQKSEAIATTRRALDLLQAPEESYARFVARLNLVRYTIVTGDIEQALEVSIEAINAAREDFESDPGVPRRMLSLFAKLLIFGDRNDLAAKALGFEPGCSDNEKLFSVLDPYEAPSEKEARESIWATLKELEARKQNGALGQTDLENAVTFYQGEAPAFFDVLDHWRAIQTLTGVSGPLPLPTRVREENESLAGLKLRTSMQLANVYRTEVNDIAAYFQEHSDKAIACDG